MKLRYIWPDGTLSDVRNPNGWSGRFWSEADAELALSVMRNEASPHVIMPDGSKIWHYMHSNPVFLSARVDALELPDGSLLAELGSDGDLFKMVCQGHIVRNGGNLKACFSAFRAEMKKAGESCLCSAINSHSISHGYEELNKALVSLFHKRGNSFSCVPVVGTQVWGKD
jgi:hypothetical protein